MALAAVCSKVVALLLLIHWLFLVIIAPIACVAHVVCVGCVKSLFCYAVLSVLFSFVIISLRTRERAGCFTLIVFLVLLLLFCVSFSRCHRLACGLRFWHFLLIQT